MKEVFMKNSYTKKIHGLLCFCLVFFLTNFGFAEEKTLILGGEKGWPQFSEKVSISTGKGRFGYTSIELDTNSRKVNYNSDLLLNFEKNSITDECSNYIIKSNDLVIIDKSIMGKYSGLSRGRGQGITLTGKPGTIFGTEGNPGSFAIEFWLKPSVAENGEVVFFWSSSRLISDYVLYQMISASFVDGHFEWIFKNIFDGYINNRGEVLLKSYSVVVPEKWAHHVLMYNEETGLIEYKIDGKTEDLKYITSTNRERGTVYQPVLGLPNDITLCKSFTGCIDDFRIIHSLANNQNWNEQDNSNFESFQSISNEKYDNYKVTGGKFVTQPIITVPGAIIKRLDTIQSVPSQTEIRYYIRTGDNFYEWTDTFPKWKEVIPGQPIENVSGRYFQLACELYPDGNGVKSPSISQIEITYYEPSLPLPPSRVKAIAGNGYVDLVWNYSLDESSAGYYVYYGTRPGEYLGQIAINGASPIDVGNINSVRINGLKNGAIYYFAIATYSKYDKKIVGNFSEEVFARPKSKNY